MRTFDSGSESRGQNWIPLENGVFNTVADHSGKPDEAGGGNSGGWGGPDADFSWNAPADADQSHQAVNEHADFSLIDAADAGQSKKATAQDDVAVNRNEVAGPSKKAVIPPPKRNAHGRAAWECNNSHPDYAADEFVWGDDGDDKHPIHGGPVIRTRAGNRSRAKQGGIK